MHQKMSFGELPQSEAERRGGIPHPLTVHGSPMGEWGKGERVPLAQEMRECPVCHARCFSDMDVCYNCLHSFTQDEQGDVDGSMKRGEAKARGKGLASASSWDAFGCSGGADAVEPASRFELRSSNGLQGEHPATAPVDAGRKIELVISLSLGRDALLGEGALVPSVKVETR